jgi:ABC-type dipeptide/oligopeptide/nickel transport system ATPase component
MKINLTSTQFCQICMCLLYEQLLKPDEIIAILDDQDYNDLMTVFKHRGMKTILQQYYLRLDPQMRVRYRMIKEVFKNNKKTKSVMIGIIKEDIKERPEKKGLVRRTGEFLSKVLGLTIK